MASLPSHVLWQNAEGTVTLLDGPASITYAQGTSKRPFHDFLLTCQPLEHPFSSHEPVTVNARSKLQTNTVEVELHQEYEALLDGALSDIRKHHDGMWCSPRLFTEVEPQNTRERKLDHEDDVPTNAPADVSACDEIDANRPDQQFDGGFFHHGPETSTSIWTSSTATKPTLNYRIPPKSSFYLGDCSDSRAFHAAVRQQAKKAETSNAFDFILLDPPWPNRSVKRTHKTAGSTYATSSTLADIRELLLDVNLDVLMSENCLVAMWITNKPAIRDLVLGEDGIFECWGVQLVEEWLWLKVTVHGEPVTPIDSVWRKPYEVLLVGRKETNRRNMNSEQPARATDVKRRAIVSVPDLHSRKPSLKVLIEPLMSDRHSYRALEVFARHLVAGWWSWGNECIKFNWAGCWRSAVQLNT